MKHHAYFLPMLLHSGFLKELPQPESSARTLLRGLRWIEGWILNFQHFQQQNLGFSSLPSLSLCLPVFLSHAQTHTSWILVPNFSHTTPSHSLSFISAVQQSLAKRSCSISGPSGRQCVFLDSVPDGCFRPRCLLWDTHVSSCFPSFFFGHQVSLCFIGHGNLSSKHILSNTKTKNIPTRGLAAIVTLVSYCPSYPDFTHSNGMCPIGQEGVWYSVVG